MPEPAHRRTASELDMSSMRRISDALLLAQNRARRATDRANQAEHVLRLVLAQVDVPRLRVDSLADYEMLRAAVAATHPLLVGSPRRRSGSLGDAPELSGSEDAASVSSSVSSSSSSSCLEDVAKDVVANLNAAMTRHKRYVAQLTIPTVHFSLWSSKDGGLFGPMQLVAGLLTGVVVGVVAAKQWQLQLVHTQEEAPSLFSKLARWYSRRAPAPGTPWHLMSLPTDEYSYLMHPATVEVA
ncbi:peroxisomal catalase [Phytophthora cinnamomi]|uniref:peroxisomal catalase n=1 Tax=Phytophthora cinnamomi TaxID=4785 RepID=UPI003559A624|nr:peroxisomal catalase [Phytophthora cinnamomi]